MSLFKVFDVAGSALSAQSVRLNVTASNLANADSVSSSAGQTYRARHPVFATVLDESGFADGIDDDASAGVRNVNVVEEMANMISASRSFQTNVEVMNASKQMLTRALSLGR
jgi:flagellar basal-body rod protein FlgC